MGTALIEIGLAVCAIGIIWIIVTAFQESTLWGLGCIFVPFCAFVFVAMHWSFAKKPFLVALAGAGLVLVGQIFAPYGPDWGFVI